MQKRKNYQNLTKDELIDLVYKLQLEKTKRETEATKLVSDGKASQTISQLAIDSLPFGLEVLEQTGEVLFENQFFKLNLKGRTELKNMTKQHLSANSLLSERSSSGGQPHVIGSVVKIGEAYFQISYTGGLYEGKTVLLRTYQDVTNPTKREKKLLEKKDRLQEVFDDIDDAYIQIDLEEKIVFVNPAAPEIFGYSSMEEMIGMPVINLYGVKSDIETVRQTLDKQGAFHDQSFLSRRKDGSLFWTAMNGKYLYDENGKIKGRRGFIRDITHRIEIENRLIRAKEEAEKNEQKLNEAQELAQIGSWELNTQTNAAVWSKELFALLGLEPKEGALVTSDTERFYTPESRKLMVQTIKNCLKTGHAYELELEMIRTDQTHFMARTNGRAMKDENGNIIGLQGTLANIDRQKRLENEIIRSKEMSEENEQRLKEAQEIANLGSWEWNVTNDSIRWSEGLFNLLGLTEKEYPRNFEELARYHTPESFEKTRQVVRRCVETAEPFNTEVHMIKKDGSHIITLTRGRVKQQEYSNCLILQGTVQDITDSKKLEQELIQAKDKAEESDRLKSAFLMNMSHEIRTPMNGILGFLGLLSDPDLDEFEKAEFISIINQSSERLLSTINDIMEISKIEIGDIGLKLERVDTLAVLNFYLNFFAVQANEKGLSIEISQCVSPEFAEVMIDRRMLDGILMNLLKNAIKYTSKGQISFGNFLEKDSICFFVRDTGKGIPKERMETIFDRFVQIDDCSTRDFEGNGIGLSIVKAYVKALNGEIWVESELGQGSSFFCRFPL